MFHKTKTSPNTGNFYSDFPDRKHKCTLQTTQKRPAHSIENRISQHGELAKKSFNPSAYFLHATCLPEKGSRPLSHSRKAPKIHRRGFADAVSAKNRKITFAHKRKNKVRAPLAMTASLTSLWSTSDPTTRKNERVILCLGCAGFVLLWAWTRASRCGKVLFLIPWAFLKLWYSFFVLTNCVRVRFVVFVKGLVFFFVCIVMCVWILRHSKNWFSS